MDPVITRKNRILYIIAVPFVLLLLWLLLLFAVSFPHHELARDAFRFNEILKEEFPDFALVETKKSYMSDDAYYDRYRHEIRFSSPLPAALLLRLDTLSQQGKGWSKAVRDGETVYIFRDSEPELYHVECTITERVAYIDYLVDMFESLHLFFYWGIALLAYIALLFLAGIIHLIVSLLRARREK